MNKTIWKYTPMVLYTNFAYSWDREQEIEMPSGAKILSVGVQGQHSLVMWALVNPEAPTERRKIYIVGTGHGLPEEFGGRRFIGTALLSGGTLVLHVFE